MGNIPSIRSFTSQNLPLQSAQAYREIASAINTREQSLYSSSETDTGIIYYEDTGSTTYLRRVYTLNSITTGTNQIALGFTPRDIFNLKGMAISGGIFIPLPFVSSTTSELIELKINGNNIEIITASSNYTTYRARIIVEYV